MVSQRGVIAPPLLVPYNSPIPVLLVFYRGRHL